MITEFKLDDIFPLSQIYVEGFTVPYRHDWNRNGRGVIIYVREDIPSKIWGNINYIKILKVFLLN